MKYPLYIPSLVGNEKKYVNECLDSTWISSKGKFVDQFESMFADFTGAKHALTCSNGTVALHLALLGLDIKAGDEVIVPTFTYVASVNAINYVGATPVFVDSLSDTWQVDPKSVEAAITEKTKAIMVVHLYGQACDMDSIMEIAKKHNLYVIEDSAEAMGSTYKETHVGTIGDVGTFSFYGNKTITTGEGGMVITNNPELAKKMKHLKMQGVVDYREYWHDVVGYNYRMTNICAAIGVAQMEHIDKILAKKRQIAMWYNEFLQDTPVTMHAEQEETVHSYWMCSILAPDAASRDELRAYLKEQEVETRPTFCLSHEMPMYHSDSEFPVAKDLSARGMNIPSHPGLTKEEVKEISVIISNFFTK